MLSWLSRQRYVSQPSSLHMRRTWFWVGPTYEAPRSTHPNCGSPASADGVSVSVRPPTRSLASRTTTSTPRSWRSFAALKPESNYVWLKKCYQEISCVKLKLKPIFQSSPLCPSSGLTLTLMIEAEGVFEMLLLIQYWNGWLMFDNTLYFLLCH